MRACVLSNAAREIIVKLKRNLLGFPLGVQDNRSVGQEYVGVLHIITFFINPAFTAISVACGFRA